MIRTIDIRLNAAHPELPLPEATTYQGAPSTAFLRGIPKACGQWQITAVSVAVTFPDNSTTTRAAVLSAGDVWVATIPACTTSGRTVSGLRIMADGTDENGDAVTGYVLGVADFAVATFDIAPAPGETSYALRYFDSVPNPPHKGDVAKIGGVLKYYDGTAWQVFADVDLSNYALKSDATLTPVYSSDPSAATWTIAYPPDWEHGAVDIAWNGEVEPYCWLMFCDGATFSASEDPNAATLSEAIFDETITATRTDVVGYYLGSDNTKILTAKEALDALAAAVAGKYAKPSGGIPATDLAAAVQASLGKADSALQTHQQLGVGAEALHWEISSAATDLTIDWDTPSEKWVLKQNGVIACYEGEGNAESLSLYWAAADNTLGVDVTATRQMAGWVLGTQSDKPLATAAQGAKAMTAVQPAALNAALPYSQAATTGGSSLALSTRSGNRYDFSAVTGTVSVTLPTIESGKCADVVCTIVTGATVPTLSFPSGAVFIAADSAWQTLAASSYNVFSFTSTGAPNEWIVGRITSALPTA